MDLRILRPLLPALALVLGVRAAPPADAPALPLNELKPGAKGQVWTVFRGTEPEPFEVIVTGVLQNALGPGKSLIVCELTDPRVQSMGAVAGMSGSPLYVEGRLAGALSYQIQRFETVRHAGFTPVADLDEVKAKTGPGLASANLPAPAHGLNPGYQPLRPVFSLGGLSPAVADLLAPHLRALGLDVTAVGGSSHVLAPLPHLADHLIEVAAQIADFIITAGEADSHIQIACADLRDLLLQLDQRPLHELQ